MMKPGAIKHKLGQVVFRHRKRFIEEGLKRRPCNCAYNAPVKFPRKTSARETVHVCLFQIADRSAWNNTICDDAFDGASQAQQCPYFKCQNTAEDLKEMFASLLGLDGTPVEIGWVAKHYPDIAALTWVLGEQPKAKPEHSVLDLVGKEEPEELPEEPLAEEPNE